MNSQSGQTKFKNKDSTDKTITTSIVKKNIQFKLDRPHSEHETNRETNHDHESTRIPPLPEPSRVLSWRSSESPLPFVALGESCFGDPPPAALRRHFQKLYLPLGETQPDKLNDDSTRRLLPLME